MTLNYKYTILYSVLSIILFVIVINYGSNLIIHNCYPLIEGLTTRTNHYPKDAVINYNDINSPLYSHTVNLPINDPFSCKNFCGPNAQCAITREQCTSDIDCQGCKPSPSANSEYIAKEAEPYDDGGKLGQQGLQYSPLTTGFNKHNADFAQIYPNSKDAEINVSYKGLDMWTKTFNQGLSLYNKKRETADEYSQGITNAIPFATKSKLPYYESKYPMRTSATGQFYETTPPPSNSSLSLY